MIKKLREWVQARINAAILPVVNRCVTDAAQPVDYGRLALEVSTLQAFRQELAESMAKGMRLDVTANLAAKVAKELDTGEIAEEVADRMTAGDVAYHMDAEDVASHVDVDIDLDEVAERIDYRQLCKALLAEMKAGA